MSNGLDYVTKLRLEMAAPKTVEFLSAFVALEVDRLGGDDSAMLFVSASLHEMALTLGMQATKTSRQDAMDALYELGRMGLP